MRKIVVILLLALLLCGCAREATFETVADEYLQQVSQLKREMVLTIADEALTLEGETGSAYLCDGYTVMLEVLPAGNLSGTFTELTGFAMDELTVMETNATEYSRYECAWTAAAEAGEMIGRAVILDDGIHHYCVTVMADAADIASCKERIQDILDSFMIR